MVSIVFHGHGDMENEEFMGLRFQGEQSQGTSDQEHLDRGNCSTGFPVHWTYSLVTT